MCALPFDVPPTHPRHAPTCEVHNAALRSPPQVGASQQAHPPSKGGNPTHLKGAAKVHTLFIAAGGEVRIRTRHSPSPKTQPTYQMRANGGSRRHGPFRRDRRGTHGAGPARQPEPGGNYDEAPLSDSKLDELELACSRARAAALAPRKQPEHSRELLAGNWQTLIVLAVPKAQPQAVRHCGGWTSRVQTIGRCGSGSWPCIQHKRRLTSPSGDLKQAAGGQRL